MKQLVLLIKYLEIEYLWVGYQVLWDLLIDFNYIIIIIIKTFHLILNFYYQILILLWTKRKYSTNICSNNAIHLIIFALKSLIAIILSLINSIKNTIIQIVIFSQKIKMGWDSLLIILIYFSSKFLYYCWYICFF